MKAQDVFDLVVKQLMLQRKLSLNRLGRLTCHSFDGSKNPIGCLIHPSELLPEFNTMYPIEVLRHLKNIGACSGPFSLIARIEPNISLLDKLTEIHNEYMPRHWDRSFIKIAADCGLIYNSIQ